MFPNIGVPQNGWFIMKNPIKMDDLGVPLFIFGNTHMEHMISIRRIWDETLPHWAHNHNDPHPSRFGGLFTAYHWVMFRVTAMALVQLGETQMAQWRLGWSIKYTKARKSTLEILKLAMCPSFFGWFFFVASYHWTRPMALKGPAWTFLVLKSVGYDRGHTHTHTRHSILLAT